MKIAYLILPYHQPRHFQRLVRSLAFDGVHCFAHVDGRVDMKPFVMSDVEHLTLLDKRFRMARASISMVDAMIELLRVASATQQFDYFLYMSGQDYPLKSNTLIRDFLKAHEGYNFLAAYPIQPNTPKAENYYCFHNTAWLAHLPYRLRRPGERVFNAVSRYLLPKRQLTNGMKPYRGLTWMGIHRETAQYLLDFLDTAQGNYVYNFFKYAWAPDEFFFHTIILNSPYAQRCYNYTESNDQATLPTDYLIDGDLHYSDWSSTREDPAIFVESDLPQLLATDALFGRKFDEGKSIPLLDKLDYIFANPVQQVAA